MKKINNIDDYIYVEDKLPKGTYFIDFGDGENELIIGTFSKLNENEFVFKILFGIIVDFEDGPVNRLEKMKDKTTQGQSSVILEAKIYNINISEIKNIINAYNSKNYKFFDKLTKKLGWN
jgi:hypothetical protein